MTLIALDFQGLSNRKLTLIIELFSVYFLLILYGIGIDTRISLSINVAILLVVLVVTVDARSIERLKWTLVDDKPIEGGSASTFLPSNLYDIDVTTHKLDVSYGNNDASSGGALEPLDDKRMLLVNGMGAFFVIKMSDSEPTSVALSNLQSPMNRDAYANDTETPSPNFRVMELRVLDGDRPNTRLIYLVHHYWEQDGACTVMVLSEAQLDLYDLDRRITWTERWRSSPCLDKDLTLTNESGGRLASLDPNTFLLTVGVTLTEARWSPEDLLDDPNNSYGKIIAIDRLTWTSSVYSIGHRNPQGLFVEDGVVWSTEHGPEGGDELNIIEKGGDYGWPRASYGLSYGRQPLEHSNSVGLHDVGVRPRFAWLPSIAVSRLIRLKGTAFTRWKGDFIVTSLSGFGGIGASIFRLRMEGREVRYVERINLRMRLRDIHEWRDGTIVLWDGAHRVVSLRPANHVFSACSGCHVISIGPWAKNGIGPDLENIVGAKVAAIPGFRYSQALKDFGGDWTRAKLDFFLTDPQTAVPGTTMAFDGIKDAKERQQIIKYLEEASKPNNR